MPPSRHHDEPAAAADVQASSTVVSQRLAKAMAHPLRVQILVELNKRPMSASQFANHVGGGITPSKAAQHFRQLEKLGCLELVEEKTGGRRRGGRERIYRAVQRSLFDDSSWNALPDSVQREITAVTFSTYIDRVAQAFRAGTIDARGDRHFTWTGTPLDEQAWTELAERLAEVFHFTMQLRVEAALRMAETGEEPIPVTVALACFESPRESDMASEIREP